MMISTSMSKSTGGARLAGVFWTHLIRFLMYNFVGALLPLMISWTVRHLANIPASSDVYAPELLFFAIMISATAIGDVTDEQRVLGNEPLFQLIRGVLLFGAIAIAAVYGMYQYDAIVGPGNTAFHRNISVFTLVVAIFLGATSFLAEVLLARIRGADR